MAGHARVGVTNFFRLTAAATARIATTLPHVPVPVPVPVPALPPEISHALPVA